MIEKSIDLISSDLNDFKEMQENVIDAAKIATIKIEETMQLQNEISEKLKRIIDLLK